jgi:beta-lactam-binding protein with PASTA domain/predicted Ser/Thr protein kinase
VRLERGQRVGDRYRLEHRLGSGGMADVWLARDEMLNRPVAVKFLHERFAQDAQFVERFRREAEAAAGLQHANVVGVYERGIADGRHWIAMEYVEGAALKDLIARGLSVGEAVEIVRQILSGARFAHARGIVHRDLKPQNVLVDGEGRARVTDFGIARAGASEITATGSVLGTAQYLSPEQAQGLGVTATSDIYSVGVMLYEALTGRVPFDADSAVAVALKQVSEQPRAPSQLNPQVSPALDAIVLRALAKDPANRFQSADEFIRALDTAEADPSGGSLGDTAAYAPAAAGALAGAAAGPPEEAGPATAGAGGGWITRRRAAVLAAIALIGAGVAVWALTRPEQVNVPAVIEQTSDDAQELLERRGFDVSVATISNCAPEDTVVEQDPPAGSEAEEGSRVTLTVSLGLSVRVPPTRDLPLAEARRRLQRTELLVETREQPSRDIRAGRVIQSMPAGGEEADCESTVTLIVSKGPNLVTLPRVIGDSEEVAEAELERLGFIVDVETRNADASEGTVIGQDPGPGSRLLRGDAVTIIVSTGAGSVIVPSVEGQPSDAATATLTGRGLNVNIVEQPTENEGEDDRVIDQAPDAGTRVRQGDTVTIFVGVFEPPVEIEPPGEATTEETPTP